MGAFLAFFVFYLPWKIWNRKLDSTIAGLFSFRRCHFVNKLLLSPHSSHPGPIHYPVRVNAQDGVCVKALLGQLVSLKSGVKFLSSSPSREFIL